MRYLPLATLLIAGVVAAAEPAANTETRSTINLTAMGELGDAPVFQGTITVPPTTLPHEPIIASYMTEGIPEEASIVPEWSASEGVHFREPIAKTLYIWAPPGKHEISVVLDWIFIDWEAKTFQRGRPRLVGTFTVEGEEPPDPPDPPDPPNPAETRVTLVYEKDQTQIPPEVAAALMELNEKGVMATEYEDDNKTGTGQIPEQYKIALQAARERGLPCLVVETPQGVVVVHDPQDSSDVLDAVKLEHSP